MGYKVTIIAAAAALHTGLIYAADLDTAALYTSEGPGASSTTWSLTYRPSQFGLRLSQAEYAGLVRGTGLAADIQAPVGPIWVQGWIGRQWIGSKGLLDAELEGSIELGNRLVLNTGISAGSLYSATLEPGKIGYRSLSAGISTDRGNWGADVSIRGLSRTDGNGLKGDSSKIWMQIYPGVNLHLHTKGYTNEGTVAGYYSPEKYRRTGLGITLRKSWGNSRASLVLEPGSTVADGTRDSVLIWRGELNHKVNDSSRVIFSAGRDYSRSGLYTYNYRQLIVKLSF